ncbi:MAG: AAA family ATPase [Desulfitobacteriaceae bacterium]
MRIERIRSINLTGLGNVDWSFPAGPVLFFSEDRNQLRMLSNLLLEIFYDLKTPLVQKAQSRKGLVEVWMTGNKVSFHVSRQFIQKDEESERNSNLVIEDETGQIVSLPEKMTLGEYLFRVKLWAFRQGGIVEWPERKDKDNFFLRVRNMRQGGDEGLSLIKVRASMVGAHKKMEEQMENMVLVKAEDDALRREWQAAHRRQEEDRLFQIEIKNLQEKEKILDEKIISAAKIQERLALLRENPDYRELRQLQGELTWLEEQCQKSESNLTTLTRESQVDWTMIEGLREECMEWACLQEQVECLVAEANKRAQKIFEAQNFLQMSGYQGLPKDEDQHLRQVEVERYGAQEKLDKLTSIKNEIEKKQIILTEEIVRLQDFAVLAGVTDADEIKIVQREKHLEQWQSSKICGFLDRVLQKQFGRTRIGERLSFRLAQYYQNYHVSNYKEFASKLKEFRDQRQLVETLQKELERLQEKVRREEKLRRIVHTRNEIIKQAFTAAKVTDFSAWLNGWEDYQRKKHQLDIWLDEQKHELEQQQMEEKKLVECAEQLRAKLGNWGTSATDRDEVLAVVMKVARQLWVKDEAEREAAVFTQKFYALLGDRNMEQLAKSLEPLADLERETRLSDQERLEILIVWHKERVEIRRQLAAAELRLQHRQQFPALSVLEKKIETVKRRWMVYEDLQHALDDAQALLETSWKEWQTKYGKALEDEAQWIFSQISSSSPQEKIKKDEVEAKRNYFAYRMAIVQLALRNNTETPLFFSVGAMNEEQGFWEEVLGYLSKLSLSRQVVFSSTDFKLRQILVAAGWQSLVV